MSREAMEDEMPRTLRRLYLSIRKWPKFDRAIGLAELWNQATNPAILRTEKEHKQCSRVSRACNAQIKLHALNVKHYENGTMYAHTP